MGMATYSWEERLEQLKAYKEEKGDYNVPQTYPDNQGLGTWVMNQKQQYRKYKDGKTSKMSESRKLALEALGEEPTKSWMAGRRR